MLLLWLTASRGCQAEKKIAQAEKKLETVTSVMKAEMREFNRKRRFKLSTMMLELARAEARNAREVGRHCTRAHTPDRLSQGPPSAAHMLCFSFPVVGCRMTT